MGSALPPVKGVAFAFEANLVSQANTNIFQSFPTLAAGDVVVIKDGVLDGNIDVLPTPIVGALDTLLVSLSADEMNADRITVRFADVAGSEWQSASYTFWTVAQTHDTTAAAVDAVKAKTDNLPESPAAVGSAMTLATDAVSAAAMSAAAAEEIASAIRGTGAVAWTYHVRDAVGNGVIGAYVWVTSDLAGTTVVASGTTDGNGDVTFYLDAGTYYFWTQKEGYNVTNPDTEVVA